jgi:hypothetical protein
VAFFAVFFRALLRTVFFLGELSSDMGKKEGGRISTALKVRIIEND